MNNTETQRPKLGRVTWAQIGNSMLYLGDCFEIVPKLDKFNIELDAVISDPPFGITDCPWDTAPPLDKFWAMLDGRTKSTANFVLFGCGKFSVDLINSKRRWYRYDMVWAKNNKVGFLNAKKQPMRNHEQVLVFGRPGFRDTATYNAQKTPGGRVGNITRNHRSSVYRDRGEHTHVADGTQHPCSVLFFKSEKNKGLHPTLKPTSLMEHLVKSYSNENDIVLDCFMGSGSTGVAAIMSNRRFIGIEREPQYFDIALQRIVEAHEKCKAMNPFYWHRQR